MTYDDIRKDLAIWTDFLRILKKDISSGKIRGYPNVLNALIKLGIIIRLLKKILDKQDNKAIRGSYDDIKNSAKEIHDIVSDSIDKPSSWIKVTGRLESFIAELNDLSESLAEAAQSQPVDKEKGGQRRGQPKNKEAEKSIDSLKELLKNEIQFSDMPRDTRRESWEWIADKIGYPKNPQNITPRYKIMQGYLGRNCPKLYAKLKSIVEKN